MGQRPSQWRITESEYERPVVQIAENLFNSVVVRPYHSKLHSYYELGYNEQISKHQNH